MPYFVYSNKIGHRFGLKARKLGGATCVEVHWNRVESGACYVKYEVVLKTASGSSSGYNIGEMTMCSFATFSMLLMFNGQPLSKLLQQMSLQVFLIHQSALHLQFHKGMTPFCGFHSTHYFIYKLVQAKDCLKCHI